MNFQQAIRFMLEQHKGGVKLTELMEDLNSFESEEIYTKSKEAVLAMIEDSQDLDYLIYDGGMFVYRID